MNRKLFPILILAAGLGVVSCAHTDRPAAPAAAAEGSSQPMKDAFLKGRIVSALAFNPHVSVFDLDVSVDNGVARLSGAVDNATERDLAIEIARGVDDIREVRSDVTLKPGVRKAREDSRRSAGQTFDDAAMTAAVKSKLLANQSTPGLKISVTTRNGEVTLTGLVETDAQRDLAGRIAENTDHVVMVHNELTVAKR